MMHRSMVKSAKPLGNDVISSQVDIRIPKTFSALEINYLNELTYDVVLT